MVGSPRDEHDMGRIAGPRTCNRIGNEIPRRAFSLFGEIEGGLQLGRAFAETRPQTPVLYTTARGVTDGTLEMFVKPYGFVTKPYMPADVLTAVKNLLDTS
jgi:hypothetical protein